MPEELITIELNPRERRFYDRVRTRVARLQQPAAPSKVRDIVLQSN